MSGDMMSFPDNWRTFVQQYQFADKDETYTNGSMLIPSFRVRQMVEHYFGGKAFSITFNSGEWEITDKAAFDDFALAYGFATIERGIKPEYMHRAIELLAEDDSDGITETVRVDPKWIDYITNDGGKPMFLDSGMEIPGITYTGKTVKGTQVRKCEPETVAPILRQMGGVDALLLEAGE